jgi:hypothetical protein
MMGSLGVRFRITFTTFGKSRRPEKVSTAGKSVRVLTKLALLPSSIRWLPFDPSRNWPDLGKRFLKGEKTLRQAARAAKVMGDEETPRDVDVRINVDDRDGMDEVGEDEADLSWSTVLKRTFEAYIRAERPNMYGEWLRW